MINPDYNLESLETNFWVKYLNRDKSNKDNFGESLEILSDVESQTWISFRSQIFKSIGLAYVVLSVSLEREVLRLLGWPAYSTSQEG